MVYVFLADGFELIERLAPVDNATPGQNRRDDRCIGGSVITASCGVSVTCDISDKAFRFKNVDAIVLPGGMPGTKNLEKSPVVQDAIDKAAERNTPDLCHLRPHRLFWVTRVCLMRRKPFAFPALRRN